MLKRYQNRSGNSGVMAYEILDDGIRVRFVDGEIYTYTFESAGRERVERMQALARNGKGLSVYIATHVHHCYAGKSGSDQRRRRPGAEAGPGRDGVRR